jgi:PAP2 superfamily protein
VCRTRAVNSSDDGDLVDDVKHLPSKENLYWAAFGGGLALAVHPADDNMNQSLVNSDFASHNTFPSGHAADTFAFATALERHLGWKGTAAAYVLSSYVAMSRLPANRHWFSDVVFGSAVGIIAGRTVTRHGRDFPVTLTVVPGEAAVTYVRRPS